MWRRVAIGLVVVAAAATLWFLLGAQRAETVQASTPVEPTPSTAKWSQPIAEHRGAKRLEGRVTFEGAPVAGAIVTAVASHGDDLLNDLKCACHGVRLLECTTPESEDQLAELVAARTGEPPALARGTTDSQGHFVLDGLDDTELVLWAEASAGIGVIGAAQAGGAAVELRLVEGRGIEGTVADSDKKPVARALVTAIDVHGRFFEAQTDSSGSFRIGPVLKGRYRLVVDGPGRLPVVTTLGDDDVDPVQLTLDLVRVVEGTLRRDGAPVSGATVKLETEGRKQRTTTTDSKGQFRFEHLERALFELKVEWAGLIALTTVTTAKADAIGLALVLVPGFTVIGTVVDERGATVAGASVTCHDRETTSDTQGHFAFAYPLDQATPEPVEFHAHKVGFFPASRRGPLLSGTQPIELVLNVASVVSGKVVDPLGHPLRRGSVRSTERSGRDAVDWLTLAGNFSLTLEPGHHTLTVTARGYRPTAFETEAPASGLVITLDRGASVMGTVVDEEGAPLVGAYLKADNDEEMWTRSDDHGRFELTGLSPGSHTVVATPSFRAVGKAIAGQLQASVTLSEGETATIALRASPGATVEGVVVSSKGEPVSGATIKTTPARGASPAHGDRESFITTGKDGRFLIEGLPSGPVTLWAAGENESNHTRWPTTVTAPASGVVINLDDHTMIVGRLVDDEGLPIDGVDVNGDRQWEADGGFSLVSEPGDQSVSYRAKGFLPLDTQVHVKPGKNDLGEVRLVSWDYLEGRVFDAQTGEGLEGATVGLGTVSSEPNRPIAALGDSGRTTSDGHFRIKVEPRATLFLVQRRDFVPASKPFVAHTRTIEVGLDHGGSIDLSLIGSDGQSVTPKSPIALRATGPTGRTITSAFRGNSTLKGLKPGTWTLYAQSQGFVVQPETVIVSSGGTAQATIRKMPP